MTGYNFTDRVRKALQLAREEALRLNHEHVGTEHLLLGLLGEGGGVALAVLADMRVEPAEVRRRLEGSLKKGKPADVGPDLPYTSRSKKVLEFAMSEARSLGHSFVGSEHLLLGLLHPGSTPAVTALDAVGVRLDAAREVVQRLRPRESERQTLPTGSPTARSAFVLSLIALVVAILALVLALRPGSRVNGRGDR